MFKGWLVIVVPLSSGISPCGPANRLANAAATGPQQVDKVRVDNLMPW